MTNLRPRVVVLSSAEKCRWWTSEEKQRLLLEIEQTGNTVSAVARKYGVSTSLVFSWRKQYQQGGSVAVRAND